MTAARFVSLNGDLLPLAEARISPLDRGFLLGDGVFETLRAYSGRPFDLDAHLGRLRRSAALARIPFPAFDAPSIVDGVLRANGFGDADAAVRITLTRGTGGHGASPRGAGPPTLLVGASPVPYPESVHSEGVTAIVSRFRKAPPETLDPRIKSLSYLPHVLARAEAEDHGAFEALLVDAGHNLVEGTTSNVFAVLDGALLTPSLSSGCLDGLTRAHVLSIARSLGVRVEETRLSPADLARADEAFLTASVLEVAPLVAVDGSAIASRRPGALTEKLQRAYRIQAKSGAGRPPSTMVK